MPHVRNEKKASFPKMLNFFIILLFLVHNPFTIGHRDASRINIVRKTNTRQTFFISLFSLFTHRKTGMLDRHPRLSVFLCTKTCNMAPISQKGTVAQL